MLKKLGQAWQPVSTVIVIQSLWNEQEPALQSATSITGFTPDQVITGETSGAKALVAYKVDADKRIYFYQNEKTGYKAFQNSEVVNNGGPGSQATLGTTAVNYGGSEDGGPYKIGSGEVIFLENRQPINRSATQIEDIKCVIEF